MLLTKHTATFAALLYVHARKRRFLSLLLGNIHHMRFLMKATEHTHASNCCAEPTEYHVASFVAHIIPQQTDAFSQELEAQQGVQVHATSDDGKVVFTVEAQHQKHIALVVEQFRNFFGLYSLSPVYHQFLTEE